MQSASNGWDRPIQRCVLSTRSPNLLHVDNKNVSPSEGEFVRARGADNASSDDNDVRSTHAYSMTDVSAHTFEDSKDCRTLI